LFETDGAMKIESRVVWLFIVYHYLFAVLRSLQYALDWMNVLDYDQE